MKIGQRLLQEEHVIDDDELNEYEIKLEQDGIADTLFGLNEPYWSITFMLGKQDSALGSFDSGYLVVFVDAENGEPVWVPETYY